MPIQRPITPPIARPVQSPISSGGLPWETGGGGAKPPVPTPLTIGAAVWQWIEADLGVTRDGSDRVSAWADQSPKAAHYAQATGADQALYVAAQLNGHPVIRFDPANTEWMGATLDGAHTQPTTVFMLMKPTVTGSQRNWLCRNGGATPQHSILASGSGGVVRVSAGTNLDGTTNVQGAFTAICFSLDTAAGAIFVQNFATAEATGATSNGTWGSAVYLGRNNAGTIFADGDLAAMVCMDGIASAGERTIVKNYWNAKYSQGIT